MAPQVHGSPQLSMSGRFAFILVARLLSGPAARLSCKPCSTQNWTANECALAKKILARKLRNTAAGAKQNETRYYFGSTLRDGSMLHAHVMKLIHLSEFRCWVS